MRILRRSELKTKLNISISETLLVKRRDLFIVTA